MFDVTVWVMLASLHMHGLHHADKSWYKTEKTSVRYEEYTSKKLYRKLTDNTQGIGIELTHGSGVGVQAGYYSNSFGHPSLLLGAHYKYRNTTPFTPFVQVSVVSGYKKDGSLIPLPTWGCEYKVTDTIGVRLMTTAPVSTLVHKDVDVYNAQLTFKF